MLNIYALSNASEAHWVFEFGYWDLFGYGSTSLTILRTILSVVEGLYLVSWLLMIP